MKLISLALACSLTLSGCAAPLLGWKSRPVASHKALKTRLWTATGERRFVTWIHTANGKGPDDDTFLLCPEPAPFTGQAIGAASKANLSQGQALTVGTDEQFQTSLTVVGNFTENLAALDRNFANACNMKVAGLIEGDELVAQVKSDNAVRRIYVLAAAAKQAGDPDIKKKIDEAVKEAVEKAKKDVDINVVINPKAPAAK